MSKSLSFTIRDSHSLVGIMNSVWQNVSKALQAGPVVVTLGREKRSLSQNAKMWAVLNDISSQVEWHGRKLDQESWKHMFSASLTQQEAVPGINGGFVVLGVPTKNQSKEWFSNLFELINAFGAEHQVKWSDPALKAFEYYKEVANEGAQSGS